MLYPSYNKNMYFSKSAPPYLAFVVIIISLRFGFENSVDFIVSDKF